MKNIFTYGSLMYPIIWQTVVSGQYKHVKAELSGYECRAVKGEEYPMVVPSNKKNALVQGVLYLDVSESDMARLDTFEGFWYDRKALSVQVEVDGRVQCETRSAYVYVASTEGIVQVAAQAWSRDEFEKTGLERFRTKYVGFSEIDG